MFVRRGLSAVLGAVLVIGIVDAAALPAQASSNPQPPAVQSTDAPAAAAPAATSPSAVPGTAATAGKISGIAASASADDEWAQRGTPAPAVVRPGDGAVTARDLESGAVRPLDNTALVPENAAKPCDRPLGRVRAAGPAGIWLTGTARCAAGVYIMTVTGGSGTVGGMALASSAFGGSQRWDTRGVTSDVAVQLPLHPRVTSSWSQKARTDLVRNRGPWQTKVTVLQGSGSQSLTMRGVLQSDASYVLSVTGSARVAGVTVPLSGWYRSPVAGGRARWSIGGSGPLGTISGASVLPVIAMTQDRPGITGTATVRMADPSGLEFPATLDIRDAGDWTLTAKSATVPSWSPRGLPGMTVNTAALTGTIRQVGVRQRWSLSAPLAFATNGLDLTGKFEYLGAANWRLTSTGGSGRIFGYNTLHTFRAGEGQILVKNGRYTGSFGVRVDGELLIDMPDSWSTSTLYSLTPVASTGSSVRYRHTVSYEGTQSSDGSHFKFIGAVNAGSSVFKLFAVGEFLVSGTPVPVGGDFFSAGSLRGDSVLSEHNFSILAHFKSVAGGVPLENGAGAARLVDGAFGFEYPASASASAPASAPRVRPQSTCWGCPPPPPAPPPVTTNGKTELTLSQTATATYKLTCNYVWTNSTNWTLTAAGDSTTVFAPFPGFGIPENKFTGTVTNVNNVETWALQSSIYVQWAVAPGAYFSPAVYHLTTTCPLTNKSDCPVVDGTRIYTYSSGITASFADNTTSATGVSGAFLNDSSWSLWKGDMANVTYNMLTLTSVGFTMYYGTQKTDPDGQITLPALSTGQNVQFCGYFQITVPGITSENVLGCVAWSTDGVILAQSWPKGDYTTRPSNNVNISKGSLSGYAWTNLKHPQNIKINNVPLYIETGKNYITSDIVVPGALMHDIGTGTEIDSTVVATGWFTLGGTVSMDASIPVGLSNGTISLDAVTVHVGYESSDFTVAFGVKGNARIDGKHYQLTATISASTLGGTVKVALDVRGTRNVAPLGGFEIENLLPSGNFEPGNTSLLTSTFDGDRPSNVFTDPSFENGTGKTSLIPNPGFEDNTKMEQVVDGGFESQSGRNLLDNADIEDTNVAVNGDFDTFLDQSKSVTGTLTGWLVDSGMSASVNSDTGPSNTEGNNVALLSNGSSSTKSGVGLKQSPPVEFSPGQTWRFSAWVRPDTGTSGTVQLSIAMPLGSSTCATTISKDFSIGTSGWTQVTLDYNADNYCYPTLIVTPRTGSWRIALDDVQFSLISAQTAGAKLPMVALPSLHGRWDSSLEVGAYSNESYWSNQQGGTLRSDGCADYMYLDGAGYSQGDIDASMNVFFPSGPHNTRDIANFAFGMKVANSADVPNSAAATGLAFRVQTSKDDGGFYRVNGNGSMTHVSSSIPGLARDTWYRVRVVVVNKVATGWVYQVSDDSQVAMVTWPLGSSDSTTGYFGQAMDNACQAEGHLWDDFTSQSNTETNSPLAVWDPANARPHSDGSPNNLYLKLTNTKSNNWSAQYQVREDSISGLYTYSAWVKSSDSNSFTANLILDTEDGDPANSEIATRAITVTPEWQQVSVTLPIKNCCHIEIRPGFRNVSTSTSSLLVDDQSLTQSDWSAVPDTGDVVSVATSTEAHTGDHSMSITDHQNGSQVKYTIAPQIDHATYHLSMWVASHTPYTGRVSLAGNGGEAWDTFTTDAPINGVLQWKQVTVDYNPPGGSESVFIDINTLTGNNDKTLFVDDVSVTATGVDAYVPGAAGNIPLPAGWSTDQGFPYVVSDTAAHSGNGFLRVDAANGKAASSYTYTAPLLAGQVYTLSTWVKTGDNTTGTTTLSLGTLGGTCSTGATTKDVTVNNTWQQVNLSCTIGSGGATALKFTVSSDSTSRRPDLDDIQLQTDGFNLADPWQVKPSSTGGTAVVSALDDGTQAHSGTHFATLSGTGTGAQMFVDRTYDPTQGASQFVSGWFKSASNSTAAVRMSLIGLDSNGGQTTNRWVDLNAGASWARWYTSVVMPAGTVKVRTQIETTTAGQKVLIDDLESRQVNAWTEVRTSVMDSVFVQQSDATQAASGDGYLSIHTSGSPGTTTTRPGASVLTTQTVNTGSSYDLSAHVRVPSGAASINGRLGVVFGYGSATPETVYSSFTATSTWQTVTAKVTAATNHGSSQVQVFIETENGGYLDLDEVVLTPRIINADPAWSSYTDGGGSITWANYDDASRARDGSQGLVEMTKSSSTGRGGIVHSTTTIPQVGATYTASVWVRSPNNVAIAGTFELWFDGGATAEAKMVNFVAPSDGSWVLVSAPLKAQYGDHTGMHVAVLQTGAGNLDVDDVALQKLDWIDRADGGSTVAQQVVYDGVNAQAGTAYMRLTNTGTGTVASTVETDRNFTAGNSQNASVYLRASNPDGFVSGRLLMSTQSNGPFETVSFTDIPGDRWSQVQLSYVLPSNSPALFVRVELDTPNASIDIDSMTLSDTNAPLDGVTTPLDHPDWGYDYLWAGNAFGIPGANLWDLSAQVEFDAEGVAGLGAGTTLYFDPTQLPEVMTGTAWIKGDMAINVSRKDPCFSVKFDAGTSGSALQINGGVLKSTVFWLQFAPKGCTVDSRSVPRGASFYFKAALGDGTVTMNLLLGKDKNGNRIFHGEAGLSSVNIGGTRYETLDLIVDRSQGKESTYFEADMVTPIGRFFGKLDMSATAGGKLSLIGKMNLSDWKLVGGGFTVNTLAIDINDQIPFEGVQCGYIKDDIEGDMNMAKKANLTFSGKYESVCGELVTLHLAYDYSHGGVHRTFVLDYDSTSGLLSGGASYAFNRSFSWKYLSHRYHRHPKVYIALSFSMDIANPSNAAEATIAGSVSVAGGSGSLDCHLETAGDDYCRIKVDIHAGIGGGHHYEADW